MRGANCRGSVPFRKHENSPHYRQKTDDFRQNGWHRPMHRTHHTRRAQRLPPTVPNMRRNEENERQEQERQEKVLRVGARRKIRKAGQTSFRCVAFERRARYSSVTQPSEALFTVLMYRCSVPRVVLSGGAVHWLRRRASSSSSSSMSMRRWAASIVMRSPS